jgi:hypothetical protein
VLQSQAAGAGGTGGWDNKAIVYWKQNDVVLFVRSIGLGTHTARLLKMNATGIDIMAHLIANKDGSATLDLKEFCSEMEIELCLREQKI